MIFIFILSTTLKKLFIKIMKVAIFSLMLIFEIFIELQKNYFTNCNRMNIDMHRNGFGVAINHDSRNQPWSQSKVSMTWTTVMGQHADSCHQCSVDLKIPQYQLSPQQAKTKRGLPRSIEIQYWVSSHSLFADFRFVRTRIMQLFVHTRNEKIEKIQQFC